MTAYFEGTNAELIRKAIVTGLISHENVSLVGMPGCGKTDIAVAIGRVILPSDQRHLWEITQSTEKEYLVGGIDYTKAAQGIFETNKTGTIHDLMIHYGILDEAARGGDPIFDEFIHGLLNPLIPRDEQAIFIATNNFVPKNERSEAMVDRIALWEHLPYERVCRAVIDSQLGNMNSQPQVRGFIPKWSDCEAVWQSSLGPKAIKCLGDFIDSIQDEAAQYTKMPFLVNNRRTRQWSRIFGRVGTFFSGSNDFSTLPKEVIDAARIAWPTHDDVEAACWKEIVNAMADPLQLVIDEKLALAYADFKSLWANVASSSQRAAAIPKLGERNNEWQEKILQDAAGDPRGDAAVEQLSGIYFSLCQGKSMDEVFG